MQRLHCYTNVCISLDLKFADVLISLVECKIAVIQQARVLICLQFIENATVSEAMLHNQLSQLYNCEFNQQDIEFHIVNARKKTLVILMYQETSFYIRYIKKIYI